MNTKQARELCNTINRLNDVFYSDYTVTAHYCRPYKEVWACIRNTVNGKDEIINYIVCNDKTENQVIDWAVRTVKNLTHR